MSTITLQEPEILLSNLNKKALELRGAMNFLENAELVDELTVAIKKLSLAELLSKESIIAIGGSQGAGKTTLVSMMYNQVSDWLPANEGRGECMPVLILEDDINSPKGYIRTIGTEGNEQYTIITSEVNIIDFQKAATGGLKEALLPVLKVPRKYFSTEGQAFLLLPGYEVQHDENNEWQQLMRQALIGAVACIIVTDQTRLANAQSNQILKDMQSGTLSGTTPIVIISKSENTFGNDKLRQDLTLRAAEVFEIGNELRDRFVICSGTEPEHIKIWQPSLKQALHSLTSGASASRKRQLDNLESILKYDLTNVLSSIKSSFSVLQASNELEGEILVKDFLETFDAATERLKNEYKKEVTKTLEAHYTEAHQAIDEKLIKNYDGFINKTKNFLNTAGEDRQRIKKDLHAAWEKQGSFSDKHIDLLGQITSKKLGRKSASFPLLGDTAIKSLSKQNRGLAVLEYKEDADRDLEVLSDTTLNDLALLFEKETGTKTLCASKNLTESIKLIPTLTLEYARISSLFPESVQITHPNLMPMTNGIEAAENIQQSLATLGKSTTNVAKGLAAILAVDFAVDGQIDTIPALFNVLTGGTTGTVAGGGMTLASVAGGMLAIGALSYCINKEIYRQDTAQYEQATRALQNIKGQYFVHYLEHFDAMMECIRQRMNDSLSARYHLNESLMRKDRLLKALSDTRSLKMDLQEQIGSSVTSISLISPSRSIAK